MSYPETTSDWMQEYQTMSDELSKAAPAVESDIDGLSWRILKVCEDRGWSLQWSSRLGYHILEASEFVEAARGKGGDVLKEAGDMLVTFLAMLANAKLSWRDVMNAATAKVDDLATKPKYESEEYEAATTRPA